MNKPLIKLYAVEFRTYTNVLRSTVAHNENELDYLDVPKDGEFIIREDEIDFYKNYGDGYLSLRYIGKMYA